MRLSRRQHHLDNLGYDHINCNPPVLIRTPKLTQFEPAQYWGGGPPGNSAVLYPSFLAFFRGVIPLKKGRGCDSPYCILPFVFFVVIY